MGGPGIINPSLAEAVAYTRWFYGICMGFDRASAAVGAAGRVFIAAVEVRWPVRTDEFLYMVGAAQAGNVRVALYEDGPAGDIPDGGALIVESASVAQAATANVQIVPVAVTTLPPGLYWFGIMGDDVAATYTGFRDSSSLLGRWFNNSIGYGAYDDPCPVTAGATRRPECAVGVLENLSI